jgi:hypothetical protein
MALLSAAPLRTLRPLRALGTFRTLGTIRSLGAFRPLRTVGTFRPLGAHRALRAIAPYAAVGAFRPPAPVRLGPVLVDDDFSGGSLRHLCRGSCGCGQDPTQCQQQGQSVE